MKMYLAYISPTSRLHLAHHLAYISPHLAQHLAQHFFSLQVPGLQLQLMLLSDGTDPVSTRNDRGTVGHKAIAVALLSSHSPYLAVRSRT